MTASERAESDKEYAAFVSEIFRLLERFDTERLRSFRSRKPGVGPEFVRAIDSLADLRSTLIERRPHSSQRSATESDSPLTFEERALIEDIFRSRVIFPKNDDLKSFVRTTLGLDVYGKNYSRTMITERVIREMNLLSLQDRGEFIIKLGEFRKRVLLSGERPQESFLRIWSRVIKGEQ